MGSNSTKLKKYIVKGDETHALELYNKSKDFKSKLNGNDVIIKESLDTWMHIAAENGLKDILK